MSICHPGPCPNAGECNKKLQIYCKCKRQKKEVPCGIYQEGNTYVECNNECVKQKMIDGNREQSKSHTIAKYNSKHKLGKMQKNAKRIESKANNNLNYNLFGIYLLISATMIVAIGYAFFNKP